MKSLLPNPMARIVGNAGAIGLPPVASGVSAGRPQPSSLKGLGPKVMGILSGKTRTRKSIIGKNRGSGLDSML